MESTIFRFIIGETRRQQVLMVIIILLSLPVFYALLNIPKVIINDTLSGGSFPKRYLGYEFSQIQYLFILSFVFFALVVLNGLLTFFLNYEQGKTTEYSSSLLRKQVYSALMGFRLTHFKRFSTAEFNYMMTQEVEPIGSFVGESIALPTKQGGILLTLLLFVFIQNIYLGLAAISLYPLQVYMVPFFQKTMNNLMRQRSQAIQELAENIQETSLGIVDLRSYGLKDELIQKVNKEIEALHKIKNVYFKENFFLKFLNTLIGNIVPFLFYSIGGYLVVKGNLSLGALVSILAAHKEQQVPWSELLDYYQRLDDSRIRYLSLLRKLFVPEEQQKPLQPSIQKAETNILETRLIARNVYYELSPGSPILEAATFEINPSQKTAIVSSAGTGKGVFAQVLAGLHYPKSGELYLTNAKFLEEPQNLLGKEIHFIDHEAYIFKGSIKENLLLPYSSDKKVALPDNKIVMDILRKLNLESDLIAIGLTKCFPYISLEKQNEILILRKIFKEKIKSIYLDGLIDFYEKKQFNANLSLFENLVFGKIDTSLSYKEVEKDLIKLLIKTGLFFDLLTIGQLIAQVMLDIFSDLRPDHPFLEEFSLIKSDELVVYKNINQKYPVLQEIEKIQLIKLAMRFIPERHRILAISSDIQEKIVLFRGQFRNFVKKEKNVLYHFFNEQEYNPKMSILENIVFGRMIYGLASGQARIDEIVQDITDASPLRGYLLNLSFEFNVGLGGKFISRTQRQLIGIARALLSSAPLIVLDKATLGLDIENQRRVMDVILSKDFKKGVIWAVHESELAKEFDVILFLKDGRILEQGTFSELMEYKGRFRALFEQEQSLGVIRDT